MCTWKKVVATALAGLGLAWPGAAQPGRVVLISIDGMRPEFYQDRRWPAPHLQELRRRGASARRMLSVFPSITYANHASLATGVSPAVHGIDCNIDFDWETGPKPDWNWDSRKLRRPPLWERARRAGLRCAAFSWPVTLGADMDTLVPEVFSVPGANTGSTEELIRRHSSPGLIDAVQTALGGAFPQSFADWDAWLPGAVHWVWKERPAELTMIHMLNLDWTQHRFGPDGPETRAAVQQLDTDLGKLIETVDLSRTTLLVVGDHGFAGVDKVLAVNRLFRDKGWIEVRAGRIRSWKVYARSNGGSAAIYCKDPALAGRVQALLARWAGRRYVVLNRAELDRRKTFERALIGLSARPGYAFSGALDSGFEEPAPRRLGQHGHLPEWVPTGWIAAGPGIQAGGNLGERRLLEVAPTVCRLLGLEAGDMELPGLDLTETD